MSDFFPSTWWGWIIWTVAVVAGVVAFFAGGVWRRIIVSVIVLCIVFVILAIVFLAILESNGWTQCFPFCW